MASRSSASPVRLATAIGPSARRPKVSDAQVWTVKLGRYRSYDPRQSDSTMDTVSRRLAAGEITSEVRANPPSPPGLGRRCRSLAAGSVERPADAVVVVTGAGDVDRGRGAEVPPADQDVWLRYATRAGVEAWADFLASRLKRILIECEATLQTMPESSAIFMGAFKKREDELWTSPDS
jgi:hypothetical protein